MINGLQGLMYEQTAKQVNLCSTFSAWQSKGCLEAAGVAGRGAVPCNLSRYN